ncbi:MAG TPA: AMP-binding protein, partial [Polyangiales bacterium]
MSDRAAHGVTPWPEETAQRYRALGAWSGHSLFELLRDGRARWPEHTALVDARGRLSYRALHDRALALANGLSQLGIGVGDAVVVQLPNRSELFELCFALFRLGARPVMALPAHRERELGQFIEQTQAVALVVCDKHAGFDHRQMAVGLRERHRTLRHVWVAGDEAAPFAPLAALHVPGAEPRAPIPGGGALALFQLSGGSTSVPKLIPRTHDDYLYSVRQSALVCRFDRDTVTLAALPAAHNFPLSSPGVLGTLLVGGKVVLTESAAPDRAFDWIERERVTVTALVPALLSAWLQHAARERAKLSSLRLLQVGGAKLHEALARRVQPELGCQLQQVFGMAEGLVCYTRLDDPLDRVVSCQGRPMSELDELRVVDDEDRDVALGEVGDLLVRGPYTIRGYYAATEHNARAFSADGYYRTGDRVRRLEDGNLVVEGRS